MSIIHFWDPGISLLAGLIQWLLLARVVLMHLKKARLLIELFTFTECFTFFNGYGDLGDNIEFIEILGNNKHPVRVSANEIKHNTGHFNPWMLSAIQNGHTSDWRHIFNSAIFNCSFSSSLSTFLHVACWISRWRHCPKQYTVQLIIIIKATAKKTKIFFEEDFHQVPFLINPFHACTIFSKWGLNALLTCCLVAKYNCHFLRRFFQAREFMERLQVFKWMLWTYCLPPFICS